METNLHSFIQDTNSYRLKKNRINRLKQHLKRQKNTPRICEC